MKILIVDTYYDKFLKTFYKKNPDLENRGYDFQIKALLNSNFGTSDTYSYYFNQNNWEAKDLIVNNFFLQKAWGKDNDFKISKLRSKIPHKFFKLPIIFSLFSFGYEIVAFFLYLKNKKQLKN